MVSTSTLSWLDSSEHERRSVVELVSALNEPGTLDELGIGTIRDTIADTLFPGTSTIQTRARYFLFIPWILQMVEDGSPRGAEDRARRLQMQLRDALVMAHGPNETGVIWSCGGRGAPAVAHRHLLAGNGPVGNPSSPRIYLVIHREPGASHFPAFWSECSKRWGATPANLMPSPRC